MSQFDQHRNTNMNDKDHLVGQLTISTQEPEMGMHNRSIEQECNMIVLPVKLSIADDSPF